MQEYTRGVWGGMSFPVARAVFSVCPSLPLAPNALTVVYPWLIPGTSQELKEVNETYKLKMYKGLAWTLATFVSLFTTLTVAMLAAEGSQKQSWEWKWEWIQVVSWEVRAQDWEE